MYTRQEIANIVGHCKYPGFEIQVKIDKDSDRLYLQVYCPHDFDNDTGQEVSWTGRKWMLSPYMCKNELVNTAFAAVERAVIHEMREKFKYRGEAIFNTHLDPDKLVDFVRNRDNINERKNALLAA
jgi:hypothetical protein